MKWVDLFLAKYPGVTNRALMVKFGKIWIHFCKVTNTIIKYSNLNFT